MKGKSMKTLTSAVAIWVCLASGFSFAQKPGTTTRNTNAFVSAAALPLFSVDLKLFRATTTIHAPHLDAMADISSQLQVLQLGFSLNHTLFIQNTHTFPVRIGLRKGDEGTKVTINGQEVSAAHLSKNMNSFSLEVQEMIKRALVAPWHLGADADLPPRCTLEVTIPNDFSGEYSLFFVLGNRPARLLQGDGLSLGRGGVTTITLSDAKDGTYTLREVK
jgi:hypothetical protein